MPTISAMFVDIDGTLVGASGLISPRVRTAIENAVHYGCHLILCTGRSCYSTQLITKQLAIAPGYAICSNGGVTVHLGTKEILHRCLLPIPVALEVIRTIVQIGAEPYVYEDGLGDEINIPRALYHPDLPIGPWAIPPRYRAYSMLLEHLPFAPICIGTYSSQDKAQIIFRTLKDKIPTGVSIIQSATLNSWSIEIYAAGVCKQVGMEIIARRLGIAAHATMAIGDHVNDTEMLAWSGKAIAMGNSQPELFAFADWITSSLEEDGVALAIERFILGK